LYKTEVKQDIKQIPVCKTEEITLET